MQTNTRTHNTDQKEETVMNNNPNRGNNCKEKPMNAISKAVSVAVLVALGLAVASSALCAEE